MGNFNAALKYTLENEGFLSKDPCDPGGFTKWGITARVADEFGFDIETLTEEQRDRIYVCKYWRFDGLPDDVAAKLFDMCVNFGSVGAVKIAQRALERVGHSVAVDGKYGPLTESILCRLSPDDAVSLLCEASKLRYLMIVKNDPSQQKFIKGWLRRAERRP